MITQGAQVKLGLEWAAISGRIWLHCINKRHMQALGELQLGDEVGRGNFGIVRRVVGRPDLVAKVLEQDQDQNLGLECEAMRRMGPDFMPTCVEVLQDETMLMSRLDGPELTCDDFQNLEVQQRLLDIALRASQQSVLVFDAHPGNYMWHRGKVLRVDATVLPGVPRYGLVSAPRLLFATNHFFVDCQDTELLHKVQRAFEFEFGTRSHLPDTQPDLETLLRVRQSLCPRDRSLGRPRVLAVATSEPDALVKIVKPPKVETLTSASLEALEQCIMGLCLARYLVQSQDAVSVWDAFGVVRVGEVVVCRAVSKADVTKPSSQIWLENTDFDYDKLLEKDVELRRGLVLFALAVRLAFANARSQAEVFLAAGLPRARAKKLKTDLEMLHRWLNMGEAPERRKLRAFEFALAEFGLARQDVGRSYERLMGHLRQNN